MKYLLIQWIISAASLLIVSYIIPGFVVEGIGTALLAAVIIGLINATIGLFLKIITIPLSILTFGIFLLVINALMLMLASSILSPGFHVSGFWAAFFGAAVMAIVSMILRHLLGEK
jgi:putative membrane protein